MEIFYLFITSLIFLKIAYVDYKEHYIYDLDIAFAVAVILAYNLYLSNLKDACIGGVIGLYASGNGKEAENDAHITKFTYKVMK